MQCNVWLNPFDNSTSVKMHTTVVIKPVLDIQAVKAPSYQDSGYISLIFHSDGLLFLSSSHTTYNVRELLS